MIFTCCDEKRKAAILSNPSLNGIDYLEVLDHAAIPIASPRQQTLLVHCLKPVPTTLSPDNVLIVGGESITGVQALWIAPATPAPEKANAQESAYFASLTDAPHVLVVRTNEWGDFSPYVLRLVKHAAAAQEDSFEVTEILAGFDPQLAEIEFSFKVECGPEFDCAPPPSDCDLDLPDPPPINYLAKDYGSFRQVLLDRLSQLLPSWVATCEADIGVMMAELVAYAGDQLSYRQDAVTTEAYLSTARSRISLRRHALLVDYHVHDGCNSRVWVQVNVSGSTFVDRNVTRFYASAPRMPKSLEAGADNEQAALIAGVVAFEPMEDANLFQEHNQILFYTWGDGDCCLPRGATEATLQGTLSHLHVGDVLIVQEVLGPKTGFAADADTRHRCAVRLTAVTTQTATGETLVDPLFDIRGAAITSGAQQPMPVTEIQWSTEDALPFALCITSKALNATVPPPNVSVAFGNVILADQGLSMPPVSLGSVPAPSLFRPDLSAEQCKTSAPQPINVRFRPQIPDRPVTQAVSLPLAGGPVTSGLVPLTTSGSASLVDSHGFVTMMIAANTPLHWPQNLGVIASANTSDPTEIDLAVVFNPSGGAPGVTLPVVLERFVGLSFNSAAANYVATQMNTTSRLIQVPSSYVPPAAIPAGYNPAPTMLTNSGTMNLIDTSSDPFLTVEATNPLSWPPMFGVVTQDQILTPDVFNLQLLYSPKSGAVGVTLPVLVEQVNGVSLENASTELPAVSNLITVQTFEDAPNPSLSARSLMDFNADQAVPVITLTGTLNAEATTWTAAPDLLGSGPDDRQFVMEVESDGTAYLRFGDGTNGKIPDTNMTFTARYRIGNGSAGSVGANCLTHFAAGVLADSTITSCTNPMPAIGGIDPETTAQIRRRAPQAFLTQERAVTMQDYIDVTERNAQVEAAYADLRWTGSWYTVFITAEPKCNKPLSSSLHRGLVRQVNQYRLAGQDILIAPPEYVSLDIELTICVEPDYLQSNVRQALLRVLGSGTLPNGKPALFAPQEFELGKAVYLSPIYAAARAVPGVQTVAAKTFQPLGQKTRVYLQQGFIPMNAFQVARMDNDPSLPGNGQLRLVLKGGR